MTTVIQQECQEKITPQNEFERLVSKYSGAGPRYTSYPTAVEFQNADTWVEKFRELLIEDNQGVVRLSGNKVYFEDTPRSYSIYIHLPFCHSLCYYCACNKIIPQDRSLVTPYLSALEKEMEFLAMALPRDVAIEQIHWGGGTPNYLTPEEMERLHSATLHHFPNLLSDAEVSVELDPRTTTPDHLKTLRQIGFNRVSLGVQDFDPVVQETINRLQTYETTREIYELATSLNFSGVNIDLIYGLPNQNLAGFAKTISQVIGLNPSRLAVYGYAHVTWKEKVQKALERAQIPTPQDRLDLFGHALHELLESGYQYIGMDHFALPNDDLARALKTGKLGRNFMGYTTHAGVRVLGLGVSSISSLPHLLVQNTKSVPEYLKHIEQRTTAEGIGAIERGIYKTFDDCIRADAIHKILCNGLIDLEQFEDRWSIRFENYFQNAITKLEELETDGLLESSAFQLKVTERGRLFARNLAMCFDAYLERHQQGIKKVFSQTV